MSNMTNMTIKERLNSAIKQNHIIIHINEEPKLLYDKIILDVEHDEQGNFVGIGLSNGVTSDVWYFSNLSALPALHSYEIIGHNVVTDIEIMQQWGIKVEFNQIFWDTMLMGHIIDSSLKDYSLKGMAKRELNIEYPTYDEIVGKRTKKQKTPRVTLDQQPLEIVSAYNALDVFSTWKLFEKQRKLMYAIV